MTDKINELLRRVEEFNPKAAAEIEEFASKSSQERRTERPEEDFKTVAPELKRELGQQLNNSNHGARPHQQPARTAAGRSLRRRRRNRRHDRPGSAEQLGSRHPISLVKNQIVEVFSRLGYTVADGPEIEDDWHVFSRSTSARTPARDMQDTFFIEKNPDILLRTHTSSIQCAPWSTKPPIPSSAPPRLPQRAISYRAHCIFHQIEGLYLDEGVSFADMKAVAALHSPRRSSANRPSSACVPRTSLHRASPRWTCRATSARQGLSVCKGTAGSKSWLRHGRSQRLTSKQHRPRKIFGFAFGMGMSASQCSNTA